MQCIFTYATVCTGIYLVSVLRFKFLILVTFHPDSLYLTSAMSQDPRLFFEANRGPRAKHVRETLHCSIAALEVSSLLSELPHRIFTSSNLQ
jgi:hypothetical protein